MIGDKIIITSGHRKKAKIIADKFSKKYKRGAKYIICIGGEAGTGKTEISLLLRDLFYKKKISTELVHIDDYYMTRWSERNDIRKRNKIIGKKEIDWDKLNSMTHTFRSDFYNVLIIQRINKYTDSIEKAIVNIDSIDILIIEGLYSLFLKDADCKIYLDGTYKDTKNFRELRNKEPQTPFRLKVLQKEHEDIIKSKNLANLVL